MERSAWFDDCHAFCQWMKVGTRYPPHGRPEKIMDRRPCQNPERHRSHDGSIQLCDLHLRQLQLGKVIDLIDGRSIEWSDGGLPMNVSGGNCEALWKHVRFVSPVPPS